MDFKLQNGDYIPDGRGGLALVGGEEETLQRALIRLTARRGAFPWLPELGSRLYLLRHTRPEARAVMAEAYVSEALAAETDVTVEEWELEDGGDGRLLLTVRLRAGARSAVYGMEVI